MGERRCVYVNRVNGRVSGLHYLSGRVVEGPPGGTWNWPPPLDADWDFYELLNDGDNKPTGLHAKLLEAKLRARAGKYPLRIKINAGGDDWDDLPDTRRHFEVVGDKQQAQADLVDEIMFTITAKTSGGATDTSFNATIQRYLRMDTGHEKLVEFVFVSGIATKTLKSPLSGNIEFPSSERVTVIGGPYGFIE